MSTGESHLVIAESTHVLITNVEFP